MTKLSTLNEIHDEPTEPWPARRHSPHRPALSYKACMARYLVTRSGAIRTIKECSSAEFADLVEQCRETTPDPDQVAKDLKGFLYLDTFEKWWALLLLAEQKCTLPLFVDLAGAQEYQKTEERRKIDA